MQETYQQSAQDVLASLHSSPSGLTAEEATARLDRHGPNKLQEAPKATLLQRFFQQLKDPMLLILMAAAAVSAATNALSGESFTEVFIILAVVLLNAVLGVVQESKAEAAIEALQTMTAAKCKVLRGGEHLVLESSRLVPGDVVLLEAGDAVPADGRLLESASLKIEEAALTGESLPRDVRSGDEVISGCVNMTGLLKVRTTKEFGESTVSKILDLVENSSMKKARAENFITRFARVYTPAVCYGALALAFVPPIVLLLMGQPARFGDWVYRALTFLVISCPCALVISIPLSFFGGIGGASACGILVKGSTYLEELARTGIVVFDKTGTLTQGTFKVVGIHPENGVTGDALVEAAALAESWSKHPISLSIKNAYGKDIDPSRVTDVQELGGHGVTAKVDGKTVAAGNARLMAKLGLTAPEITEPGTIVHVAVEGRYAGYLLIADVVKPHSAAAIRGLKQAGVRKTVMLTGDAEPVAKAVSAELGLDEYHAGLLPGDKVDRIETLLAAKQPKENLAFVGDGINDAPVLSRADVGIAMGALGSDAAIEAADVVLMDDDPAKIALAMRIARRTLRIVYQNIVFALAIKFACLVLGALGLASMWTAIFADVGVMVLAVLNATRALYTKDLAKKNVQ